MCKHLYRPIIVLCEGSSEEVYVACLNRFLNSLKDNKINFVPKGANGYQDVRTQLKKIKRENPKIKCVIWMDEDVFKRGEAIVPKVSNNDVLCLNRYNFEDFLVMHLDKKVVMKWQEICSELNHFQTPIVSKICLEKITKIFPNYKKGSLPDNITINASSLENLLNNHLDTEIAFSSDFVAFLKKLDLI